MTPEQPTFIERLARRIKGYGPKPEIVAHAGWRVGTETEIDDKGNSVEWIAITVRESDGEASVLMDAAGVRVLIESLHVAVRSLEPEPELAWREFAEQMKA